MAVLLLLVAHLITRGFAAAPQALRTELSPPGQVILAAPISGTRLSWQLPGTSRGDVQAAWQVQVQRLPGGMAWDSGRREGTAQQVILDFPLEAGTDYEWRVQSWVGPAGSGNLTATWSSPLAFATAPDVNSWALLGAHWIGGANQLRSEFSLPSNSRPTRARVHVTGLGAFYLYLNGVRVGDHVMDPPQTVYPWRVAYTSFDVQKMLKPGNNSLGAMLGNYKWGYTDLWCNMTTAKGPDGCRALILQLVVDMDDGSTIAHTSRPDGSWHCRHGPVVWDHLFHGETYDARRELQGWASLPFSTWDTSAGWMPVKVMSPPGPTQEHINPIGPLVPAALRPLRIVESFMTKSVHGVGGRWIFDFGQNVAGFVTLSLRAGHGLPEGTAIRLEHGEIIHGDSAGDTFNTYCHVNEATNDLRDQPCTPHQTYGQGHELDGYGYIGDFNDANMTNVYIVGAGDGAVDYTPFFAAAGFRYVTVSGLPSGFTVTEDMLLSHFVHTDVRTVGNLRLAKVSAEGTATSATPDILNSIHHLVRYAQLSNLWSVPTDCPQRERRGWMGDAQVTSNEAMLNFDMQAFYENFLDAMRDDQLWGCSSRHNDGGQTCGGMSAAEAAGSLPDVVPFDGIGGNPGCPVWQVAYIVILRNYWRHYGDLKPLTKHYSGVRDLMAYFQRHLDPHSGLLEQACYGDWVCVDAGGDCPRTPAESVTAFYYALALDYLADIAEALGNTADAANWTAQHVAAVKSYHVRYFNELVGGYSPVPGEPRGSQTSNAMALVLGAPPDAASRAQVVEALVENVEANDRHFTFGIVGSTWLFPALGAAGRGDLGLSMLLTDTYPGFGHMVQQNMTTLCENWKCGFHDSGGGSQNHIMYGGFDAWVIEGMGGLSTTSNASSTAWEHFVVHPDPFAVSKLRTGGYTLETRFGLSGVQWDFDSTTGKANMNVTVPVGSTASILHDRYFPHSCTLSAVTESGALLWSVESIALQSPLPLGILSATTPSDETTLGTTVGSGSYAFSRVYACPDVSLWV